MPQNSSPELYLSLLSGRYSDESHISTEPRHNDIGSRISGHLCPNDLLDAFASICVRKGKGEVFFVSLAMESDSAIIYVASNYPVPLTISDYLHTIRRRLAVLAFDSPNPTDIESSPNPNITQPRTDRELDLKTTIYEHTYPRLRDRFLKKAPAILAKYPSIMASFRVDSIATEDTELLAGTIQLLRWLKKLLDKNETLPRGQELNDFIDTIDALSKDWQRRWNVAGDGNILTCWDNLIRKPGLAFRMHDTIAHHLLFKTIPSQILAGSGYYPSDGCSRNFSPFPTISVPSHALHGLTDPRLSSREISRWFLCRRIAMAYPSNSLSRMSSPSFFPQKGRRRWRSRKRSTMSSCGG